MSTELHDLRARLPRAEAALRAMEGERDVCLEDRRKSEEAQQSLVRSLELTQQQHEQLDATVRQESKEAQERLTCERDALLEQRSELQTRVETSRSETAHVQTLLEEARSSVQDEMRASACALEQLRAEAAEEKQRLEVASLKVKKKNESAQGELEAKLLEAEKSLRESTLREQGLQRDVQGGLARDKQGQEAIANLRYESNALQTQVLRLEGEASETVSGVALAEKRMAFFVDGTSTYLNKITLEFRRICAEMTAAERERDALVGKVKELLDEDALATMGRRCSELHWQLDQALARAGHIDHERQTFIAGLEAALARTGHEMQELTSETASWKGAHAAAVRMMEESCESFAAHAAKCGQDKEEAVHGAHARERELGEALVALRLELAVQTGNTQRAEKALQLVCDQHINTESLTEGTLEHLHRKCRGLESQLVQMQKKEREEKMRAAQAERQSRACPLCKRDL